MSERKTIKVAFIGNQNSGKTSLFNYLVGARQKVGNWPGVTVERFEGCLVYKQFGLEIVDLPGIYSLIPYTPEEKVTLDYLTKEKPDIIINTIDANNLDRNLYLTTQLLDLGHPVIGALTIFDETKNNGITIDIPVIKDLLGIPLIPISVKQKKGITELCEAIITSHQSNCFSYKIEHYADIELAIHELVPIIAKDPELSALYCPRWVAVKLLERDKVMYTEVSHSPRWLELSPILTRLLVHLEKHFGQELLSVFVESRYSFINGVLQEAVKIKPQARTITQRIDDLLINQFVGLPIFFAILLILFNATFSLGAIPVGWLESAFAALGSWLNAILPAGLLRSLLVDGVVGGVGGVLTFVPNILILFFGISLLEASGYFARAAFIVDRFMHKFGLHGKSFIPMLLGFGCSVPAFMACRTLKNKADRLTTMLVLPFISCGARLPVYIILVSAFFAPQWSGLILFGIHMFGVLVALVMAWLLKAVMFKGESEPFVMELPPYRLPSLKNILIHTWEKTLGYLRKAGTVLLGFAILIWFLTNYPVVKGDFISDEARAHAQLEYSVAGNMGKMIEPVIRPLGFNWETGVALVAGLAAKEVVVTTLSTIYSIDSESSSFSQQLRERTGWRPLNALTLMVFVLLYVPCMAATGVFHKEINEWRWTGFFVVFTTGTAYVLSYAVFTIGTLFGF